MAFKEGDLKPEGSGRQKGTPNKRTFNAQKIAQELDFDPLEFLVMVVKNDWKGLGFKSAYKTSTSGKKGEKKVTKTPHITFHMRLDAAKELIQYVYPKLRSVEIDTTKDETDLNLSLGYKLDDEI